LEAGKQKEVIKMWIAKKVLFGTVVFLIVALFSTGAGAEKRIGILLFSKEVRYIRSAKGFTDKLQEEGFGEPGTKIMIVNAGGDRVRAAEVVRSYSASKLDLIFTVATSSTVAMSREIKDVPIVFAQVYDPVAAGIVKDWKSSGNNTTGASNYVPMSEVMERLKQFAPVKRLGVVYGPGEKNSEIQLKELQNIGANYGIKVVPAPLTRPEEAARLIPVVLHSADALYITGSTLIGTQIPMMMDMVNKTKVVTITHLEDLVEEGVLLGVCTDTYLIGRLAGEKAIRILKGAKPSSIPIGTLKQFDMIINLKTARAAGLEVPPDFMKTVKRSIK
jgi:putative ABC transport system substrate-binding protein